MRAAIAAGAAMINDVGALTAPGALEAVRETNAAVCLMHMQGEPATMQQAPHYDDVVAEVREFLVARARACEAAGIARERIVVDPGFGFGKTLAHNLALLRALPEIAAAGYPVLAGLSRKSSLGTITGRPVEERMPASLAAALAAIARGASIVRVHDVRETVDALKVWLAVRREGLRSTMTRQHFGTDGIRGRVGEPPITPEFVLKLGWAAGRVLAAEPARAGTRPAVLIGKDTRISGYLLEAALEAGLSAAGVDVYLSGRCRRPAVAYLTRALRLSAGIVISASHNPFDDNGIKFFGATGAKLPDAVEHAIERTMALPLACVRSAELGKARRIDDAAGRYIEFCKSTFPNELDLKGWRIVVDCANGAGYHVAPPVFHELGAEVIAVGVRARTAPTSTTASARRIPSTCARRCSSTRPISASRSTATATGW